MHWIWILSSAFTVWMLVDAIERGVARYWICVILCPFGELAYFFAVKIHDYLPGSRRLPGGARLLSQRARPALFRAAAPSLEALRHRVRENPCLEHELDLARGLYAAEQHAECAEICERLLERDDSYVEAHYGLARSRLALKQLPAAEQSLRDVIELERGFEDYSAWFDLAEVLVLRDRRDEAIALMEELARVSPRLSHVLVLARHLREAGRGEEARRRLEHALADFEQAPRHLQRLEKQRARHARELLRELA